VTGLDVRPDGSGVRFPVRVQPRAANEALVPLLASELGVPRRAVRTVAGATGRTKVVEVDGVDEARVRALTTG